MTRQGYKFEYKVLIGAKSSETDKIYLKEWITSDARNDIPQFEFTLVDTTDAETIIEGQTVEFYRREYGEGSWGDSFFIGEVRSVEKPLRADTVIVRGIGLLGRCLEKNIPHASWGNTHIVDEAIPITFAIANGKVSRISGELDNDLAPQVPLERLRYLKMEEGIWGFNGIPSTFIIYDTGAASRKVAQSFIGHASELRKMWLKGYQDAANNADLIFEIQTDNQGVPSGTVVATYTMSRATWGAGVGNEAWMEVNFLANVADPTTLRLWAGGTYWIVMRVSAQGANNSFTIECTDSTFGPNNTRAKESVNAAAYALNANKAAVIFGLDFESEWIDLDYTKREYWVEQLKNGNQTLFLLRQDVTAWDVGGKFDWKKDAPMVFSGQPIIRATYWKGTITYATALQKWAEAVASDIYLTLNITLTEPSLKQFCLQLENTTGMDALKSMLQYCPVVVRIYKNAAGNIIMDIKDALAPTAAVWNATYNATQKGLRTFYDGRDSPASQAYVRIVDGKVFHNLTSKKESLIVKDSGGNIISAVGSIGGSGKSTLLSGTTIIGGAGSVFNPSNTLAASTCIETAVVADVGGSIQLEGIDQSILQGPFRWCNELCYVKISRKGIDGYYAVSGIKWSGGTGKPTKLELAFINQIYTTSFVTTDKAVGLMGSGLSLVKTKDLPGGSTFQLGVIKAGVSRNGVDGKSTSKLYPAGVSDCPTSGIEDISGSGISTRADMPIMHRDGTHTYLPAKVYSIQIGTGAPGGGNLGHKVAEVLAQAVGLPTGYVVIQAKFRVEDLLLSSTWPQTITEFALAYSDDNFGANKVQVGAYTVGSPGAGKSTFGIQPDLIPGRRVTVAIQVTHN